MAQKDISQLDCPELRRLAKERLRGSQGAARPTEVAEDSVQRQGGLVVTNVKSTHEELLDEIERLRLRLKEAEEALSRSGDVIYRFDMRSGSYEYISPSATTLLGLTPDELLTMNLETALSMIRKIYLPCRRG
jgi:PAS domain-containing protein